jgi:hypothetical protein
MMIDEFKVQNAKCKMKNVPHTSHNKDVIARSLGVA